MLEIAYALSYSEYEDVKDCLNVKLMWDKLVTIYGGDTNFNKAKVESLRGKFDDMRMLDSETISQYCVIVKDVVNVIRGANGIIDDKNMVRKVLRKLLPKYAIRVSAIQELKCIPGNVITLKDIVGRLITFELDNFENVSIENVETNFQAKLTMSNSKDRKIKKN